MRERKRKVPVLIKIIVVGLILVAGWIGLKMATVETELAFVSEYEMPELINIENVLNDVGLGVGEQAAVVVNNRIAYQNKSSVQPIASTAKIILALMVMQEKPFDIGESGGEIEITQTDVDNYQWYINNDGSTTVVELGERISQYDALVSLLLASSNNMADTLARWAFSSISNYSEYANKKLAEWGLGQTKVGSDASGYNDNTVSTAEEMAILGQRLMAEPVLREIVAKKTAVVPVAGKIENSNKLLGERGIAGIKTGYNGSSSGYCLISGYFGDEKNGGAGLGGGFDGADGIDGSDGGVNDSDSAADVVTVALLGAGTRQESFADTLEIVERVQENLMPAELVQEGQEVGYYDTWWTGKVPVVAVKSLSLRGWQQDNNKYEIVMDVSKDDSGENKDGKDSEDSKNSKNSTSRNGNGSTIVGRIEYKINNNDYLVKLSAENLTAGPSLWQRFLRVFGWRK